MATLDKNEDGPTPKRVCKSTNQSPSKKRPSDDDDDDCGPVRIDRQNFFKGISLKPNGLFDLPDLNDHFDKQFDELLNDQAFQDLEKEYIELIKEAEKKAENRINLEAERLRNEEIQNINCENPLDEMSQDSEEDDLPLDRIISNASNSQPVSQEMPPNNSTRPGSSGNNESSKALPDKKTTDNPKDDEGEVPEE